MKRRAFILLLLSPLLARGADWPQWRGLHRDGVANEDGLLEKWPKDGPPLIWTSAALGAGYSGPAIVGDRLYIMGSDGKNEFLSSRKVDSGEEIWQVRLGPEFKNNWGNGARGTPTVTQNHVVALGAQGALVCVELKTGKELWRTNLRSDHAGKLMHGNLLGIDWGYSESPLVDGNRVIVSAGGSKGTVAAFDLKTGNKLWRTETITDNAAYSSAVIATIQGTRQYVQLTGGLERSDGVRMDVIPRAIGIEPENGNILWQHKINYYTAGVINTPVVLGDFIYTSCGYAGGCTILRIEKSGANWNVIDKTTKETRKVMSTYHGGLVAGKDCVFGYSSAKGWVCQSIPSGDERWAEKGKITAGSVIRVGSPFIIVMTDGAVAIAEPQDDGWTIRGEFILPRVSAIRKANSNIRVCTHPVVANGRLYVRDQELLYCHDLRKPAR
jgi:hypothetical protein